MVKRKMSFEVAPEEQMLQFKRKKVSSVSGAGGKIDTSDPKKVFQTLLGGTDTSSSVDDFFKDTWEKKHLHVKRNDADYYGELFSLASMKEIIKNNCLFFETDVNVCRYVDDEKELLNEDREIVEEDVDPLFNEKRATFQFHHPQRYVDELWNIMEKLETYFGSLVGSNVYITPPKSQGLAPHCDDVEIFVMQLEGKKHWKLYKPMVELSRDYTQDLPQESIGEPVFEVTLEPGDMLYFPRGTIHQAVSVGDTHSTHISLSTYQQNTWGDFMNHAVTQAIEKALEENVETRSGLPINYMSILGTGRNMSQYVEDESDEKTKKKYSNLEQGKVKEFKSKVKNHLMKLVDYIDVNMASDAMCNDYFLNRLPPYGHVQKERGEEEEEEEEEKEVALKDKIKIKYPDHVRVVYDNQDEEEEDDGDMDESMEEDDDEKPPTATGKGGKTKSPKKNKDTSEMEDEDDEEAEGGETENHIRIVHTMDNNRFEHMGPNVYEELTDEIRFNVSFASAAVELLNSKDFVSVKSIKMDDDDDKVFLASTLLQHGIIEVKDK